MQYEYCSGAVLYTKVNNIINYILVEKLTDTADFPKVILNFVKYNTSGIERNKRRNGHNSEYFRWIS